VLIKPSSRISAIRSDHLCTKVCGQARPLLLYRGSLGVESRFMSAVAVVIGVALVCALAAAAVLSLARRRNRRRCETPKDRYQRDIQQIHLARYRATEQRYTRQNGDPGETPGSGAML